MSEARTKATLARTASHAMGQASAATRSAAIQAAARLIRERTATIVASNRSDMERSRAAGMPGPLLDRLMLDSARLESIASALEEISRQDDPLGRVSWGRTLDSGVRVERVSVPMGVVAMIYEARPNVTADAFALCVRAGNACVLKGGGAARESCIALAGCCKDALIEAGLPADAVQYVDDDAEHTQTSELVHATGLVDVLIPRGGASLIRYCVENATVPVIETGTGNCHIYLHRDADVEKAVNIVVNAKCSRPGVCNAAESLVVHRDVADRFFPMLSEAMKEYNVVLRADAEAGKFLPFAEPATEEDFGTEYLALMLSVKTVDSLEEAIEHINRYHTGHSDCIVTRNEEAAGRFLREIDSACVYVNVSTRFTDGFEFGFGAEIGISTQKLQARGPMGLREITSYKYQITGQGQVRG